MLGYHLQLNNSGSFMSEENPDKKSCISSLPNEPPSLVDLSATDKPWDKHRKNADTVSEYYTRSDDLRDYGDRVRFCAEFLDFRLVPEHKGEYKLKLASARFCRVRHCPVCQWRRSLMWKAKAYKVLPTIVERFPTYRWLFLTLTIKNCPITELKDTLMHMNKSFKRLTELKAWPAIGWLKSVEVTRGKDGSAHPHFHCLLMVKPGYFGKNYIKQAEWVEMWRSSLRVDYNPVLDVQAIKKGQQPMQLVPELLKYCTKESDLTADQEWFLELTRQMHKMKGVVTGGVLKEYLRELEEEPSDLIGKDNLAGVDEGHLFFEWRKQKKKYKLVNY
jgi:plasmid rolling circle replication initiator protein Rep